MYQALYRKWRPRTFDDVVGQQHITETLRRQVETGRLSHAYLFVGTRGTGKTTCAKILAKAVNCEHPVNGSPCNKCPSCLGIDSGSILDVAELDAASNNGVDNVRALRDEAVFSPASVRKRVYIVDEVHMLSTAAFNALLKILEEPPEHLIFILATTEIHKVPATILSRCQRFSFKRLQAADIAARLRYVAEKENLPLTEDGAELLARLSDGALRDGLSLLDQCSSESVIDEKHVLAAIGLAGADETVHLMDMIADGDVSGALTNLDRLYTGGKDMAAVLDELLSLLRDALLMKLAPKTCAGLLSGSFDAKAVSALARKADSARLLYWLDTTRGSLADMSRSPNRRIAAELCLMRLSSEALSSDVSSLSSRIERLETAVLNGVPAQAGSPAPEKKDVKTAAEKKNDVPWDDDPVLPVFGGGTENAEKEPPAPAKPEKAKAPEKAPEAPAPVPEGSGDIWDGILAELEKTVDHPPYLFLSDRSNTSAELTGNVLTVYMKNPFTLMTVDTPEINAAIKAAAAKLCGRAVAVKLSRPEENAEQSGDKLDKLAKFGNIKFE